MIQKGLKPDFIIVMIAIYPAAKLGLAKRVTSGLLELLGKNPITMEEFVHGYREQII